MESRISARIRQERKPGAKERSRGRRVGGGARGGGGGVGALLVAVIKPLFLLNQSCFGGNMPPRSHGLLGPSRGDGGGIKRLNVMSLVCCDVCVCVYVCFAMEGMFRCYRQHTDFE